MNQKKLSQIKMTMKLNLRYEVDKARSMNKKYFLRKLSIENLNYLS